MMIQSNITDQFNVRFQIEETYRIAYFDIADVNERLPEILKCQLREIVNQISTVKTISECENLIKEKINDDITLIINCSDPHIIEEIIKCTCHYRHLSIIYIINHHRHETVDTSKYSKVFNVYIEDLVPEFATHQTYRQKYNFPGVSLRDRSTNSTSETFGVLEFINKATRRVGYPIPDTFDNLLLALAEHYAGNNAMLRKVAKFKCEYTAEQALWWYTSESFIFDIVNKALRTLNFSILQLFTFFIRDVHVQLSQLYEICTQKNILRLYRGQAMNRIEVNHLKASIGEIVSMNSFLSTSKDRDVALGLALASIDGRSDIDELNAVLFEIEADPTLAIHTPFADISQQSQYRNEEEYLFHLNTLFRVTAVENDRSAENITIIRLTLTSLPPRQDDDMLRAARTVILNHTDDIGHLGIHLVDSMSNFMTSNGDIKARKLLEEIKNSNQINKHDIFIKNGNQAISYRRYLVAIDFYREALRINPLNAYTWVQIAKSYHNLTNHEQAITVCHHAMHLHATNDSFLAIYCHYLLAMSLSETEKKKEALVELEKIINIVNSIEIHNGHMLSDEDRGSPRLDGLSLALGYYIKSGKKPELLVDVYEQMGKAYEVLHDSQTSLMWFQKALDLFGTIKTDTVKITRLEKQIERIMSNITR